jgi:hypothetical protein
VKLTQEAAKHRTWEMIYDNVYGLGVEVNIYRKIRDFDVIDIQ